MPRRRCCVARPTARQISVEKTKFKQPLIPNNKAGGLFHVILKRCYCFGNHLNFVVGKWSPIKFATHYW
jgi:hypothetical protein